MLWSKSLVPSSFPDCPEPVARVAELMAGFRPSWFLCGGWAADSWLGRQTREHHDIDITVFHDDQRALFDHLTGWQLLGHDDNVADDSSEPWDGRRLDLPAHIHARPQGAAPADPTTGNGPGFNIDVILNVRSGDDWVFSREPRITMPLSRCVQQSPWGLPTVSPEVVIFYKAHPDVWRDSPRVDPRPHDELDFLALLPSLRDDQRNWLWEAISLVQPGHPWLARLAE